MVENTECFNNNPQNRNNNKYNSNIIFINYKIMKQNKQKNYPNEKEKNTDNHSL